MRGDLDRRLAQVASLSEPARRALYRFVIAAGTPVTREKAAEGVDVALHVAKFHLDRLVDDGLLSAGYRRPPGRGGPGAGRPAKVYEASAEDLQVSVPPRRYDVAGELLARAIGTAAREGLPVTEAVDRVAKEAGRERGAAALGTPARRPRPSERNRALLDLLTEEGYEPCSGRDGLTLENCPFHALARVEVDVVCDMNRAFVAGLLDGLGLDAVRARLDPADGRCCVRVSKAPSS